MSATELRYLALMGWPPRQPQPNIAPNDALIEDSDYAGTLTKSATQVSCLRPTAAYAEANPGWKRRFRVSGSECIVHFDNLNTLVGTYNGVIAIYVDGVLNKTYTSAQAAARNYVRLAFATAAVRDVEIVMPNSAAIAFAGVTGGSILAPSTSRTGLPRAVFGGDSRAQGFSATGAHTSWPELLCRGKNWQHINLGIGSRVVAPADGTMMAQANPDVAFYLCDYNNRTAQTALATFKQAYKDVITNFRALKPTTKFYAIQSTWISAANDALTLKMTDYRQAIADALTELADANNVLVDGLALTTVDDTTRFTDGIHPNDTGAAEIATALAALVSV